MPRMVLVAIGVLLAGSVVLPIIGQLPKSPPATAVDVAQAPPEATPAPRAGLQPDAVATGLRMKTVYPDAVRTLAFSPDGTRLAAGTGEGKLFVWNLPEKKWALKRAAHSEWLFDLAFSPGGDRLYSGGGDNLVQEWDTASWEPLRKFSDHFDDLHGVAITPDGQRLVSGGDDMRVVVRELSVRKMTVLEGHERQVTSVSVSPDGMLAASSSRDGTVRLWNLPTLTPGHVLTGHTADVLQVNFSPDGKQLVTASYDQTARLWDVATGQELTSFNDNSGWVFTAAFLSDGQRIVTGSADHKIRLFRRDVGLLTSVAVADDVADVVVSPDGSLIAAGISNGTVQIYQLDGDTLSVERTLTLGGAGRAAVRPLTVDEYLAVHNRLLESPPGEGWNVQVALLGQHGDRFSLYLLQQVDRASLSAPQAEMVKRLTDKLTAEFGDDAERIPVEQVARFLELAAITDLRCHPLERVMPGWTEDSLRAQLSNAATRAELVRLQQEFRPTVGEEETFGSVSDRVRRYITNVLADESPAAE